MLDLATIRAQFPILHQEVNGHPLVYLDNAATSQKPQQVIDALSRYYTTINSNVHRGAHALADAATAEFEKTRETARQFINAQSLEEVIFTKGTTEAINLVASSFGKKFVKEGDEIIISAMEHHSNIVPWQILCETTGAVLKVIPVSDKGELLLDEYEKQLSSKTRLVAVMHVSNVLGTINDVAAITRMAHEHGARVLVDGAQSSPHMVIDVQALNCDFYVFSSHKVYGPTGIGVLYGKKDILEAMPPYLGGGEMIKEVTFEKSTYNQLPFKFEAGTPNIGDTIAFRHAMDFVNKIGKENLTHHEHELLDYGTELLSQIDGLRIVGTAARKISVISFLVEGVHSFDLGMMLDANGIAIRTGHHCAQPLMNRLGLEGTARASFAVYNTKEEIATLAENISRIARKMKR